MNQELKTSSIQITDQLLQLLTACTAGNDAAAPDTIANLAYELLADNGLEHDTANVISDAVFELTSLLVADTGTYL